MRDDAPDELLDDQRLNGVISMLRVLMPDRNVLLVDDASLDDAVAAVRSACERWGGASHLLVPCARDVEALPAPYDAIESGTVDRVWTRGVSAGFRFRGTDRRVIDWSIEHFLVGALSASRYGRNDYGSVIGALPSQDHPWFAAYLATLGDLANRPDARLVEIYQFLPDLEWSQVFDLTREAVTPPSGLDLLSRLRDPGCRSPAAFSMTLLGAPVAPRAADIPSERTLPNDDELAAEFGPNLVVVYEPGSVPDICAIWNLRAANGHPRGLPLGVPDGDDVVRVLDEWTDEHAQTHWGLRTTRMALVSASVSSDRLEAIAAAARADWEVVDLVDVFRVADRPGRVSSVLASFRDGHAEVPGWDTDDRSELARNSRRFHTPEANVRLSQRDRRLPRLKVLDHDYGFETAYRGGGFEQPDVRFDKLMPVRWPAGWTVLTAVAHDLGLRVEPSAAGQAATAFLRHVKSWAGLEMLLSPPVTDLLYRLGERSGMTWFRNRVRDLSREAEGGNLEGLARIEAALNAVAGSPTDHDQHTVDYSRLVSVLGGRDAATAWLSWAEGAGIVVRGVDTKCEHCGARAWRAMGELAPPLVCRGCGRSMRHPFGPAQLPFRYRGAETLLRVLEHDALVHLYAMRFFARLFEARFDRASLIYGMYPGVDFYDGGQQIGEADVAIVLNDGRIVVGECKRHGAGLDDRELAKLETLAERVSAPWTFLATTAKASECPSIWPDGQRALPDVPRFCLSGEQLFERHVVWTLSNNPLEWVALDDGHHTERIAAFRRGLPDAARWLAGTRSFDEQMIAEAQTRDPEEPR